MASVPNYYYNSPWIADAARNLASALKPTDPDVLREREQNAWEFQHAKDKAAQEVTDRENKTFAAGKLGELAQLFATPVIGADGKPDRDATRAAAAAIQKEIYERGGPEFVNEAEAVAGPLSAAFMAKHKLRAQIEAGQWGRLRERNDFTANENENNRTFQWERDEANHARRLEYLDLQGQQRLAELNARAAADSTGKAITLTPAIGKAITVGIYQRIRSSGLDANDVDDAVIYRLFDEIADDTSRNTHNYATSLERIWNTRFPGGSYKKKGGGFWDWGDDDDGLTPDFNAPLPAWGAGSPGPTTTVPTADAPRDLADPLAVKNPFLRGSDEIALENAAREAASAETAALPRPGAEPSTGKPASRRPANVPRGGSATGKSASSPIPVKTPGEAAKLPAGTWIIDDRGRVGQTKGRGQ